MKGALPLAIFITLGMVENKYIIVISALAGVFGHAFSPMLRFKRGKAVAVSFGAWSVLTKWEASTILGITFTIFTMIKLRGTTVGEDALRVIIVYIVLIPYIIYKLILGEMHLLLFYIGNFSVIWYKHWKDLKEYLSKFFNYS